MKTTDSIRQQDKSPATHLYGPVPSRRLGFSLGVDIIPFKTCSFNCIYCQLGPTRHKTIRRKKYFSSSQILSQIKRKLSSGQRIDHITFSGSGEPTQNIAIGYLIREIKKMTSIPVAVLTNASLLSRKSVREALSEADIVLPSLDGATEEILAKINRPHPSLRAEKIIDGLRTFRQEFKGRIWLEVMLVKGLNDSPSHLKKLKEAINEIMPDRVQLNTVVRPPAEKSARPLSLKELERIKRIFGRSCEIIAEFEREPQKVSAENLKISILSMMRRRPVTFADISASLGKNRKEIQKSLKLLVEEGKINLVSHKRKKYYEPVKE